MTRRTAVQSLLAMTAMSACSAEDLASAGGGATLLAGFDPRLDGFHMPMEDAPHSRTFMQWPNNMDVYDRPSLRAIQASIAQIANRIAAYEPVVMLMPAALARSARAQLDGGVEIWDIPTDDLWCRDSGPTFVTNANGQLAVAHIRFNGWGNKQTHGNDGLVAARVAERLGLPLLETGLVGEQGGVEHDGAGTLLAHASSWVNPNRSDEPADQIAARLMRALGGRTMLWAPGIKGGDITDYHIDALARFVGPGKLLIQISDRPDPDDPWSVAAHQTLAILEQATSADGQPLQIIRLPEPVNIRATQPDFVASYVNYYVCNGAVIAAQFGDADADARAKDALAALYPGRTIEMLDVDPIGESGGGIHCATQQQPVGNAA